MRTRIIIALWLVFLTGMAAQIVEFTDRPASDRLFRQKCFRCHDASLTLRPVSPVRIDSLVQAMRNYDTLWIKPHEAQAIAEFMKRSLIHQSSQPSQHKE